MKLKTNLHLHTNDDPEDHVEYSAYDVIDRAASLGFDALAITCHNRFAWKEEYASYAADQDITLIRGIESTISETPEERGKHVLILGAQPDIEHVRTFDDLAEYKDQYPEIVIVAPHPYFDPFLSLQGLAEKHIDLFDAVEHSWFYSRWLNRNKKAIALAKAYQKPLIATSDTHFLDHLNEHFTYVDAPDRSESSILRSIKNGSVTIQTRPHKLFSEMLIPQLRFTLQNMLHKRK